MLCCRSLIAVECVAFKINKNQVLGKMRLICSVVKIESYVKGVASCCVVKNKM